MEKQRGCDYDHRSWNSRILSPLGCTPWPVDLTRAALADLPGLTLLPDEFRCIPATGYHHIVHIRIRHCKEVVAIVIATASSIPSFLGEAVLCGVADQGPAAVRWLCTSPL